VKISLKRPLKVGEKGAELTELNLRERLCAGDYRGLTVGGLMVAPKDWAVDDVLKVASRLSGQPDVVINDLSEEDLGQVVNALIDFRTAGKPKAALAGPETATAGSP
jgi:hypothetical protein